MSPVTYHTVTAGATVRNDLIGNAPLHCLSQPARKEPPKMHWYVRVAASLREKKVSNAEVGRELGISGQAITLKLQGKRPVTVEELKVMSRLAGLTVAEAVGDSAVVLDLKDEMDLIELYRLLTPDQRRMLLGLAQQFANANRAPADNSEPPQ